MRMAETGSTSLLDTSSPLHQGVLHGTANQTDEAYTNRRNETIIDVASTSIRLEVFIPDNAVDFFSLEMTTELLQEHRKLVWHADLFVLCSMF